MRARMILSMVCALLAVVTVSARTSEIRKDTIVSVSWLADHLKDRDLVLLHVGTDEEYRAGHIPGARHVVPADLSTPRVEGSLTLEMPPVDVLTAKLESLGISNRSRIVVYAGNDWVSPTARVVFTLDYVGLGDRTSMLDGGMRVWQAGNHPVTTDVVPVTRGVLHPKPRPELIVDAAWVSSHVDQPKVAILDARDPEYYDGRASGTGMRGGHIPSASSLPFSTLVVEPQLEFVDVNAMRKLFLDAGAAPGDTVVSYCHIGQQASLVYLAARYLGYDARVYDGSFQDWSRHTDFPVVATPAATDAKPDK